jgi:hypothetical protein
MNLYDFSERTHSMHVAILTSALLCDVTKSPRKENYVMFLITAI